jgi:DNA-binding response OmpR family regulator
MATILIVEDDGLIACHAAGILRRAGHMPIIALNVRAALLEGATPPDLVLLELGLPDMPGEEFLRWLRARPETAALPVLLTTGRDDLAACVQAADSSGLTTTLLKPLRDDQLRDAVATALSVCGAREVRPLDYTSIAAGR